MSPAQADEVSSATTVTPSLEHSSQLIQLMRCPTCSSTLREPFTLPCGRTVCQACLPEPHERVNVSYPAREDRRQGLRCPFPDCAKEHALGDCAVDITLRDAVSALEAALEKNRESAEQAGLKDDGDDKTTLGTTSTGSREESDAGLLARVEDTAREELECRLCLDILYEPVTAPCGHTLCRPCLQRALDGARYCPICRSRLSIRPAVYPSNRVLSDLASYFWPDHLEKRQQMVADDDDAQKTKGNTSKRPIFVNHVTFPGVTEILHIFEPRYRLMIRRALEGDRTFGIVGRANGGFSTLGTLVRITNFEFSRDGRIFVQVVGTSRFRILKSRTRDGYVVARIQPISDISIAEEEEVEAAETGGDDNDSVDANLKQTPGGSERPISKDEIDATPTKVLMDLCLDYVEYMRGRNLNWLTPKIRTMYGLLPRDPAAFPWWFASVLPVTANWKLQLLSTTSVRERLKLCWEWILEWEGKSWWTPLKLCNIM